VREGEREERRSGEGRPGQAAGVKHAQSSGLAADAGDAGDARIAGNAGNTGSAGNLQNIEALASDVGELAAFAAGEGGRRGKPGLPPPPVASFSLSLRMCCLCSLLECILWLALEYKAYSLYNLSIIKPVGCIIYLLKACRLYNLAQACFLCFLLLLLRAFLSGSLSRGREHILERTHSRENTF